MSDAARCVFAMSLAGLLGLVAAPGVARAGYDLEVIAYSGGDVPGLPGALFDSLYTPHAVPVLNDARQLAFWGELAVGPGGVTADRTTGLWGPAPDGTLSLLVREGDPVPGDPGGRVFGSASPADQARFALSGSGHVAVQLAWALVRSGPAGLEAVVLDGVPLPGMPAPYENETSIGVESFSLDPAGQIAFNVELPTFATGVFLWDGGPAAWPLVFQGDPAPAPAGTVFWYMGGPVFADTDRVAHHAELLQDGIYQTASVWISDDVSGGRLLGRVGDPVPGGPAGAYYAAFSPLRSNGQGEVGLFATLDGSPACAATPVCLGIVLVRGESEPEKVVMSGDPAPGAPSGAVFDWVERPDLNAAGQLAFGGWLNVGSGGVTSGTEHGIWGPAGDAFVLRARAGDAAPGVPGAAYADFGNPELNDAGQILFDASLATGSGVIDAVFLVRSGGGVEPVLYAGEMLEVAPGDSREVLHVRSSELAYGAGPRRALNATGDVALTVEFVGGSSAVVLARRHRPKRACGLGLELALLLPVLLRRYRSR